MSNKREPNKDRKILLRVLKQIDYFVNSFSDLSPYKKK
jgi:hypothetical protein